VSASYAQKGQDPCPLLAGRTRSALGLVDRARSADSKPIRRWNILFGLGRLSEVGPDLPSRPTSYTRVNGGLAFAVRFERRLMAVVSGEYNQWQIP